MELIIWELEQWAELMTGCDYHNITELRGWTCAAILGPDWSTPHNTALSLVAHTQMSAGNMRGALGTRVIVTWVTSGDHKPVFDGRWLVWEDNLSTPIMGNNAVIEPTILSELMSKRVWMQIDKCL